MTAFMVAKSDPEHYGELRDVRDAGRQLAAGARRSSRAR